MNRSHSMLGLALAAVWGVVLVRAGIFAVRYEAFSNLWSKLLLTAMVAAAYVGIRLLLGIRKDRLALIIVLGCLGLLLCGPIAAICSGILYCSFNKEPFIPLLYSSVPVFFGTLLWLAFRNREEIASDHPAIRVCATINTGLMILAMPLLLFVFFAVVLLAGVGGANPH